MPKQIPQLSLIFQALADPTRRAVLERLCLGPAPVSELAQPFAMALPSFIQHLRLLEGSGLVHSVKSGRVRTYQLAPQNLEIAENWLAGQRSHWEQRLDQLDAYLLQLNDREKKKQPES